MIAQKLQDLTSVQSRVGATAAASSLALKQGTVKGRFVFPEVAHTSKLSNCPVKVRGMTLLLLYLCCHSMRDIMMSYLDG